MLVPTVLNLVQVDTIAQYENLTPPTTGTKKNIPAFAVLPPALAEVYQTTDMTPAALLIATVQHIKVLTPAPPVAAAPEAKEAAEEAKEEEVGDNTDAILKRIDTPYAALL